MYDALHTKLARRLEYIQRSLDIGIHVRIRRMIGIGDGNQCGQMQDNVAALQGLLDTRRITHIPREDIQRLLNLGGKTVQPPPRIEGVVLNERTDFIPFLDESLNKMRANKAIRASNQDFFVSKIHAVFRPILGQ
ncbi:hypothetical protein D3C86_1741000 [compost metagenome]